MDDKAKIVFGYASEFVKSLLTVSAGSLTFILTFFEKITPKEVAYLKCFAILYILALFLLLLSSLFTLFSMREIIYEINTNANPSIFALRIKRNIKKSIGCLCVSFVLLIILVSVGFLSRQC